MTWQTPGSPDPSDATTPDLYGREPQGPPDPPAGPAGWPPWGEAPQPGQSPQLPAAPPGLEILRGRRAARDRRVQGGQRAPWERESLPAAPAPAGRSPARAAVHPRVLVPSGLSLLAAGAVLAGLVVPGGDAEFFYSARYWSVFAAVCALVQLAPVAGRVFGWRTGAAWTAGAGAVAGLLLFWLLIVLPVISSNESFVLTAGVAAAGGSWLAPGRRL